MQFFPFSVSTPCGFKGDSGRTITVTNTVCNRNYINMIYMFHWIRYLVPHPFHLEKRHNCLRFYGASCVKCKGRDLLQNVSAAVCAVFDRPQGFPLAQYSLDSVSSFIIK